MPCLHHDQSRYLLEEALFADVPLLLTHIQLTDVPLLLVLSPYTVCSPLPHPVQYTCALQCCAHGVALVLCPWCALQCGAEPSSVVPMVCPPVLCPWCCALQCCAEPWYRSGLKIGESRGKPSAMKNAIGISNWRGGNPCCRPSFLYTLCTL